MLKGAVGGALAGIAARFGVKEAAAQSRRRPDGATCVRNSQCQSDFCDPQTRTCGEGGQICGIFETPCPADPNGCCDSFDICGINGCISGFPTVNAAPATVWRALTDPKALGAWAMDNDVEATVGHRFQLKTQPRNGFDGVMDAEILELDAPRRVVFRWRGGDLVEPATVEITLHAVAGGAKTDIRFNRLSEDGAACGAAAAMLGARWQHRLLRSALPRYAERLETGEI